MVQDVTKKIEGIQNQKNPEEVHRVPGGPKFSQKIQRQKDRTAMKYWVFFLFKRCRHIPKKIQNLGVFACFFLPCLALSLPL